EQLRNEFPFGPYLAIVNPVDDLPEQLRLDTLVAITPGARLQAPDPLPFILRGREEDHPGAAGQCPDDRAVADPANTQQVEVQEKNIGRERCDRPFQAASIRNVSDRISPFKNVPPPAPQ